MAGSSPSRPWSRPVTGWNADGRREVLGLSPKGCRSSLTISRPLAPTSLPSPRSHNNLAPDLVQQPQRKPQPKDPPPHRRRRHLPDRASIIRLVGAVLAKQHDESAEGRRYLGLDMLTRSHTNTADQETATEAITA